MSGSVIAKDGDILISKGYGRADLEHDVPNTPQTKFRLASITKQFTAMAILMLQEQGKLSVEDLACTYIPDCPETWQAITIHQLLTHTSGLPDSTELLDEEETPTLPASFEEVINAFGGESLKFKPGKVWHYSNLGYAVLGRIIEEVSGESYGTYLDDNIFQPLDMENTGCDENYLVLEAMASGYRHSDGEISPADYDDMSVFYAAGGLYSTVEDLYLWDRALYTESLVSQDALDMMFTPFAGSSTQYGYGWDVDKTLFRRMVGHGGIMGGFRTDIRRFVDDDVVIIVLSNIENAPIFDKIAPRLRMIVFYPELF